MLGLNLRTLLVILVLLAGAGCSSVKDEENTKGCSVIGLKIIGGDACELGDTPRGSGLVRLVITSRKQVRQCNEAVADGVDGQDTVISDGCEADIIEEQKGLCTGTVIDQYSVLTAAHCFADQVGNVTVETFVSSNTAKAVYIHPSYAVYGSSAIYDVALVTLDQPLGVASYPLLSSRQVNKNEEAVVAGFGQTRPEDQGISGVIHAGVAEIDDLSANHVVVSFEDPESHPCFGDSGGPLLVAIDGQYAIAGTVSQVEPSVDLNNICREGDQTLYTNINDPLVHQFISEHVRNASYR